MMPDFRPTFQLLIWSIRLSPLCGIQLPEVVIWKSCPNMILAVERGIKKPNFDLFLVNEERDVAECTSSGRSFQIVPALYAKLGPMCFLVCSMRPTAVFKRLLVFVCKCKGYIFFYILFKALDIKVFISILTKTAVKFKKKIIRIKPHVRNSQSFKELHISSVN